MRFLLTALYTGTAVALLAGCSGSSAPSSSSLPSTANTSGHSFAGSLQRNVSLIPAALRPHGPLPLRGIPAPAGASQDGIYVGEFFGTSVLGYYEHNTGNHRGPRCTVSPVGSVNDIATDNSGNLIEPDGSGRVVNIYSGPTMCGTLAGSIPDSFGQPADASSANALTGTVLVGNIVDTSQVFGSVLVCSVASGCTSHLTNSAIAGYVAGVALDNSGNCWASANGSAGPVLIYWAGCTGTGVQATGYVNTSYGGLDIDKHGNLVSMDSFANGTGQVYVYSGCNPACTVVGGPFALHGEAVFGKLTDQDKSKGDGRFATGDFILGQVDVYKYSPTAITYLYSFNNGMSASLQPEGVAYNPRSPQ